MSSSISDVSADVKLSLRDCFKGHGFSRAESAPDEVRGFSPRKTIFFVELSIPAPGTLLQASSFS